MGPPSVLDWLVALLRDWGVGLDISLYEEAIKYRFDPDDLLPETGNSCP